MRGSCTKNSMQRHMHRASLKPAHLRHATAVSGGPCISIVGVATKHPHVFLYVQQQHNYTNQLLQGPKTF
jgi:ABC-type uncharacterized transport system substrate-binding protein